MKGIVEKEKSCKTYFILLIINLAAGAWFQFLLGVKFAKEE